MCFQASRSILRYSGDNYRAIKKTGFKDLYGEEIYTYSPTIPNVIRDVISHTVRAVMGTYFDHREYIHRPSHNSWTRTMSHLALKSSHSVLFRENVAPIPPHFALFFRKVTPIFPLFSLARRKHESNPGLHPNSRVSLCHHSLTV